jgi:hypothetical protein
MRKAQVTLTHGSLFSSQIYEHYLTFGPGRFILSATPLAVGGNSRIYHVVHFDSGLFYYWNHPCTGWTKY